MHHNGTSMDHFILAGGIGGLLFAILAIRGQRLLMRFFFAAVSLCLLLPAGLLFVARTPAIMDARYRTFQLFYWNLGIGMNRDQVFSALAEWYPPGQEPAAPRIVIDNGNSLEFVMTPDASRLPANERIVLKTEAGLITGKDYIPDR